MARSKTWIVQPGPSPRLGDVLAKMGTPTTAIDEGRVFVGRTRAKDPMQVLKEGARVEVFVATERVSAGAEQPRVLDERAGLIAVYKPAGIPTIPDHHGSAECLASFVARHARMGAPTDVHATSRLDTPVSGVVVFATTQAARDAVVHARETGAYRRRYVALGASSPVPEGGIIEAPLGRAKDPRLRCVNGTDATHATTKYRVVARAGDRTLVAVEPVTGRTHQIRVHMAHAGAPLLGDSVYGGPAKVTLANGGVIAFSRVGLHAAWVSIRIKGSGDWTVRAEVATELKGWWTRLGGSERDWQRALAEDAVQWGAG